MFHKIHLLNQRNLIKTHISFELFMVILLYIYKYKCASNQSPSEVFKQIIKNLTLLYSFLRK